MSLSLRVCGDTGDRLHAANDGHVISVTTVTARTRVRIRARYMFFIYLCDIGDISDCIDFKGFPAVTGCHIRHLSGDRGGMSPECEFCPGALVELRRRVIRGGAVQFVFQCQGCGEPVGSAVGKARVLELVGSLDVPEFDAALPLACRKREAEESARTLAERKRSWFEWYSRYLTSPEWLKRRDLVLRRAGGVCEGCGEAVATEVHHLSYENAGAEFLFELVALCAACHRRYHETVERRAQVSEKFVIPEGRQ